MDDTVAYLVPELLFHIFSNFVDVSEIAKVALVCKEWRNATKDSMLWRFFVQRDYPDEFVENSDYLKLYQSLYSPVSEDVSVWLIS